MSNEKEEVKAHAKALTRSTHLRCLESRQGSSPTYHVQQILRPRHVEREGEFCAHENKDVLPVISPCRYGQYEAGKVVPLPYALHYRPTNHWKHHK